MHEWLQREHVRRWWRDARTPEVVEEHYGPAIDGAEPTKMFVIEIDGAPVGSIQTYLVSDYPEWEATVQVGEGVVGVDLLIGEEELTGQGLGPEILATFAREVATAPSVIATVEEGNRRSWRAFEKAGFRHVRDVEEDGLPCRLMRLDR